MEGAWERKKEAMVEGEGGACLMGEAELEDYRVCWAEGGGGGEGDVQQEEDLMSCAA